MTAFQHACSESLTPTTMGKIDLHSHYVPPFWRNESAMAGYSKPDGMPAIPDWSAEVHLQLMAQANITKSILSITSPGTFLTPGNDKHARRLARQCNEFAADLKRRHPDKFGFWAALPLPDVEGSLAELAYALDHLDADGVAVFTNAQGVYLGDDTLKPLFRELDRRKTTVFVHPTSPCIRGAHGGHNDSQPAAPLTQYPNPMFEFLFEEARAVANLFLSGTVDAFPNVTYIISHAGGALPPTIERFSQFASSILGLPLQISSSSVKEAFARSFYFDIAGFVFPDQIYGLLRYVSARSIVYGSDYPYTPAPGVLSVAGTINEHIDDAFPDPRDVQSIFAGNAQRILDRV
ncbi:2-amino-3-carboxymuconate-6-semialdehyde decarboxylase [Aspergillus udagawae]|uniref:6-methylsalicylate decarboxylase n=1 Tax=Aspergillus udagawae TaxID=91492 RepID=A0A8H3P8L9_9EURO|nr:2-amino-3-carboxymuconate-6-semialdehyde decarboxylase [Aspergillus udagawae]